MALRNAQETDSYMPVVIAQSDKGFTTRRFEVASPTADGFNVDSVLDCRWVHSLRIEDWRSAEVMFMLPADRMREVDEVIVEGLEIGLEGED